MLWFRFYAEALNDPKVQQLEPEIFKMWVNILCLAAQNNGVLPSLEAIAFSLRASLSETETAFHTLREANLIDEHKNQHGQTYSPHNWPKRQYKSDSSTERVKRFRNVTRNNTVTPSETDTEQRQNQNRTETDKEKNLKKDSQRKKGAVAPAAVPNPLASKPDDCSQQVWDDFILQRKAKKAPFTVTALADTIREAGKVGKTLEEALAMCTRRGWQGFESRYVQDTAKFNGVSKEQQGVERMRQTAKIILGGLQDD